MCGIAGIWQKLDSAAGDPARIERMVAALHARGPDDGGTRRSGGPGLPTMALGHRRLAIVDLSPAGHQPMENPEQGAWIVFNGEIYNFTELRKELEEAGQRFRSRSDTEVILKAYAAWGHGAWRRLRGIFAFGLWDAKTRELHLVRDHLGVKPLYLARRDGALVFASEVRSVLASGMVEKRLSASGLVSYLKYGSVQEPESLVAGVTSLPPGHCLTVEADGRESLRAFWRVAECVERNPAVWPPGGDLRSCLEDSVRRQMMADVPVGVFLSGGLDSTAIAALAMRSSGRAIRTFCIGSDDPACDESAEAARTAELLGTRHETLRLEGRAVAGLLAAALDSYDQPSYDGINSYFVSQAVRAAGIKVALSGLGGDEVFVGYQGFGKALQAERWASRLAPIPAGVRDRLGGAIARGTALGASRGGALAELLRPSLAHPYFASRVLFAREHIRLLLADDPSVQGPMAWEARERELADTARRLESVNGVSFLELQTYMLSTLLRDSDQMSMAHGLELRVPFVDPCVVEQVLPVAAAQKVGGAHPKRLLVEAMGDLIPAEVLGRKKRGFTLPFQQWLTRDLQAQVEACFEAKDLFGPWEPAAFRRVWAEFRRGKVAWARVFALYVLEQWLRRNGVRA